jgi:hypothetical protein
MGNSERGSNHGAQTPDALTQTSPTREVLEGLGGFRVEWDDGSVGIAGGTALFVRTVGFGSGHQKLELLAVDDIVAILPEERRILARTRLPPAAAAGHVLRPALARALRRLFSGRRNPAAFCRP